MATKKEKDELLEKVRGDIATMVEANPEIKNEELREHAIKLDPAIEKLDGRVFNARYVLQAKRRSRSEANNQPKAKRRAAENARSKRAAASTPTAAPAPINGTLDPDQIHKKGVLIAFARELGVTADFATVMNVVEKYAAA